jgi:hypothetical protein
MYNGGKYDGTGNGRPLYREEHMWRNEETPDWEIKVKKMIVTAACPLVTNFSVFACARNGERPINRGIITLEAKVSGNK